MKRVKGAAGFLLAAAVILVFATAASASEKKGLEFRGGDAVSDVIQRHMGKTVEVHLASGEKLKGTVASVGQHAIHLSALVGMEFFDAVVRISDISAVVVRTRDR